MLLTMAVSHRVRMIAFLALVSPCSTFGQSEIQAFIPNLYWTTRVEPVWPEGTREQGLQGLVE